MGKTPITTKKQALKALWAISPLIDTVSAATTSWERKERSNDLWYNCGVHWPSGDKWRGSKCEVSGSCESWQEAVDKVTENFNRAMQTPEKCSECGKPYNA